MAAPCWCVSEASGVARAHVETGGCGGAGCWLEARGGGTRDASRPVRSASGLRGLAMEVRASTDLSWYVAAAAGGDLQGVVVPERQRGWHPSQLFSGNWAARKPGRRPRTGGCFGSAARLPWLEVLWWLRHAMELGGRPRWHPDILLLPELCGRVEIRAKVLHGPRSMPATAAPSGVVPFLFASLWIFDPARR